MAGKRTTTNGHDRLDEAMATLIQNHAAFVAQMADSGRHQLEFQRQQQSLNRETAERFARIEVQMSEIIRVPNEHGQILEGLTAAIREKIGFKH